MVYPTASSPMHTFMVASQRLLVADSTKANNSSATVKATAAQISLHVVRLTRLRYCASSLISRLCVHLQTRNRSDSGNRASPGVEV